MSPLQNTVVVLLIVGVATFSTWRLTGTRSVRRAQVVEDYTPPAWLQTNLKPEKRVRLGHLPTPVHEWHLRDDVRIDIKRDDWTGSELSGNKVRKLEFLLADALEQECTAVVTVGGIQSNHCRATAVAARRLGLEPHLILRGERPSDDRMLVGNLMLDRLVGATLHFVSDDEFQKRGGGKLVEDLVDNIQQAYGFPSGGSNSLGTFGYVEAVNELLECNDLHEYDRLYFACGSGGTAAGLALGLHCASKQNRKVPDLVGLCVDDDPDFFYDKIDAIFHEITDDLPPVSTMLRLEQAIGDGYALSTDDELKFIIHVAQNTGVVLDPVYSGKAARGMLRDLNVNPLPTGTRVLFIHTGGHLGLYGKDSQLNRVLREMNDGKD